VAYMIPITWTLDGIKTVMGGEATLQPGGGKQATGILSDQKRDQEQSQLTLVVSALQSSKSLYQAFDSLQYNGRTVRELKEELVALNEVLQLLQETVNRTDTGLSALELPLSSCAEACAEFAVVVARCTTERSRSSFRDWARLSYLGKDIAGFRLLVAGYKSTITIALADANM
jgi:Fungal N-terminal domain of STAND proteins